MFVWAGSSVQLNLPVAVSPASLVNFGAYIRDIYRLHFAHEVAAGALKPLILPYAVLGSFILPILYFSIPHVNRPWLHHARWPLMAFILAFNLYETWTASSANFAIGYTVGLMQAWGILWTATLLVWMRPQFEAERVEKRKRRGGAATTPAGVAMVNGGGERESSSSNGHAAAAAAAGNGNAIHHSGHETPQQNGHVVQVNGHSTHHAPEKQKEKEMMNGLMDPADAPDEDIAKSLREGYEYYWQAYPADAPLATRLGWSIDLVLSFRGTGWNWCVPVLPHFAKPEKPLSGALVDLGSIPLVTRQGYRRYRTGAEWLRAQVVLVVLSYLALDLLSVLMMKDPYFILGPEFATAAAFQQQQQQPQYLYQRRGPGSRAENPLALPPLLASLPPVLLVLYHSLVCFGAILVAINLIMTLWQMAAHFLLPRVLLTGSARGELWHYPCVYGSFVSNVLDKGVAGFWGGWWHQTFRVAFSAPSLWLARNGWINLRGAKGKTVAGLIAFAQSGFLHMLGSVSCLPPSKPWLPPLFFLLCWVGILVQTALSALLHHVLLPYFLGGGEGNDAAANATATATAKKQPPPTLPTWLRRTGNFLFVFVYLNACQFLMCDDLGRSGIWLLEPVPASPLRALGLGKPGDSWWRWDPAMWPRWHFGGGSRWWETGIAL